MQSVVSSIKPQGIINTVAPNIYPLQETPKFHYKINVEGTKNLIRAATACSDAAAFVYTSSAYTVLKTNYLNAKESDPVNESPDCPRFHTTTKAIADRLSFSANDDLPIEVLHLLDRVLCSAKMTFNSSLACSISYKKIVKDIKSAPTLLCMILSMLATWQRHTLGLPKLLCVKLHKEQKKKVDKLAESPFFITNDDPRHFYDFVRQVWQATGFDTSKLARTIIPSKVALSTASAGDWTICAFALEHPSISSLSREDIGHRCLNRTHDISKAKKLLGYSPTVTIEEGIQRGVSSLRHDY